MKKIFTLAFVFVAFMGNAQVWFDLGAKVGYGPSLCFNTNSFDNLDYGYKYSGSLLYGGKLGINFNPNHALVGEALFNQFNYSYTVKGTANTLHLKYFQIPVMYRYNGENGGYTEIGPQFSMVKGAEYKSADVMSQFVKTNYDVVFGFGQYIGGGNVFGLNLGFRLAYTMNDIIDANFRTSAGNAVYAPSSVESLTSFKYQAAHNVSAVVTLELNFDFGYLAKGSNCHKGTRFKMF